MSAAPERPNYLARIDEALENRSKLAVTIAALTSENHSRYLKSDIQKLIAILQSDMTAERFVQDSTKAVWLPLVLRASNAPSAPGDAFQRLLDDLTVVTESRKSTWSHFVYPLIVLTLSVLLFVVIATTIVPTFQSMFREFSLRLPPATKLLFEISSYIQNKPVLSCVWLVLLIIAIMAITRSWRLLARSLEGMTLLGACLAGNAESVRAMGRFTATLAELLHVGAPLADAIAISGRASLNPRFNRTSAILASEVGTTHRIPAKSNVAQNFPSLVLHALEAGPDGTPCIALLRRLSSIYFERVRQRVVWTEGIFAPLTIVGIGLFVGLIVISLFLPIISLITSLSG